MKQKNIQSMNQLVILLILSSLLIGLGLLIDIPCCIDRTVAVLYMALMTNIFGNDLMILFAFMIIPILILFISAYVMYAEFLLFVVLTAAEIVRSAMLAVRVGRQVRQDDRDDLSREKNLIIEALALNAVAAGCVLAMNLLFVLTDSMPLYPGGLLSVSLCLAGGVLLVFGVVTVKGLEITPNETLKDI